MIQHKCRFRFVMMAFLLAASLLAAISFVATLKFPRVSFISSACDTSLDSHQTSAA